MFRIAFDPKGGYFKLQFQRFGVFWRDVKRPIDGDTRVYETIQFRNYGEARRHVENLGLPQAFDEQCTKGPIWVSGYGVVQMQPQAMLELH